LSDNVFPIHFNHISIENSKVKYGVISQNLFLKDLIDWNILTIAGRMHKPTISLTQLDAQTRDTIYGNRRYALNVALLLLIKRQNIPVIDLYMKIAEISYMGDIRFSVNIENKNKIKNIV
jgi:translocator assembly and maintenance protein 41